MELTSEHLAKRLPYRLKIQGQTLGQIATLSALDENNVQVDGRGMQYGWWADIFEIRPILHPLSDLDKEIEHHMDRFVPIERLREFTGLPRLDHQLFFRGFFLGTADLQGVNIQTYNKLLEWHFDIDGLIEAGLAVDVNTLYENPYK